MKRLFCYFLIILFVFITSCGRNDLFEHAKSYLNTTSSETEIRDEPNSETQDSSPKDQPENPGENPPENPPPNPPYSLMGQLDNEYFIYGYTSNNIRVAIQEEDKVIVGVNNGRAIILLRLKNYISEIDTNFGNTGSVIFDDTNWMTSTIKDVKIQPDNKILVGFEKRDNSPDYYDILIARFTPEGQLDTSFNNQGFREIASGSTNLSYSILTIELQSANNIIVGARKEMISTGYFYNNNYKISIDGNIQESLTGISFPLGSDYLYMSIAPNDNIVISGSYYLSTSSSYFFGVGMLKPDGTIDTSFDSDGIYYVPNTTPKGEAHAIAFQKLNPQNPFDYKIILGGKNGADAYNTSFAVVRLHPTGTNPIDVTFGTNGVFQYQPFGYSECIVKCLHVEPDGKIVIGGNAKKDGYTRVIIFRIDKDGKNIDTTFGTNGVFEYNPSVNYNTELQSWAVQSNGFLVCGAKITGAYTQFAVLRIK